MERGTPAKMARRAGGTPDRASRGSMTHDTSTRQERDGLADGIASLAARIGTLLGETDDGRELVLYPTNRVAVEHPDAPAADRVEEWIPLGDRTVADFRAFVDEEVDTVDVEWVGEEGED